MHKFSSHLVANTAFPHYTSNQSETKQLICWGKYSLLILRILCVGKMQNFNEDSGCLGRPRTTYQTKRRHVPEDLNPRWHCREDPTFRGLYVKAVVWMPLCVKRVKLQHNFSMKIRDFWDVTACCWVCCSRRFERSWSIRRQSVTSQSNLTFSNTTVTPVHSYNFRLVNMYARRIIQGYSKWLSGFLTTFHTQYTWDRSICIFLFNWTTLQVFVTYLICAPFVILQTSTRLSISFQSVCSMSAVIIDYRVDVCRITKSAHIEHL